MTIVVTWPKEPFKLSRIISLVSSADAPPPCPSICGVSSYHKLNGNYFSYINRDYIPIYPHTRTSTSSTTTTNTQSSPLAWKPWLTTVVMSATCRQHGKMLPIFVPTGQIWQHGFLCVGTLLCRDFPTLTYHEQTRFG